MKEARDFVARTHPQPLPEIREGSRSVRFAGYAARFDLADRGGDIVRRGAFAGARAVPLLFEHDFRRPAGAIETIGEDARGLRVIGRAKGVTPGMGLSFGYRVRSCRGSDPRELLTLELVEVSLVRFPMQPLARVHAVEASEQGDGHGL